MYRVVKDFFDLQDNLHEYKVGDKFPHDGISVRDERINELSTEANKLKTVLIVKVEEEEKSQRKGRTKKKIEE